MGEEAKRKVDTGGGLPLTVIASASAEPTLLYSGYTN